MIRNDNKTKEEHLLWIICSWLLPPPEAGVKCTFMSFAEARYSFMFVIVHCLYVCLFAYIFVFVYLHCTHTLSCVWVCTYWCAIVEFVQLHIGVCVIVDSWAHYTPSAISDMDFLFHVRFQCCLEMCRIPFSMEPFVWDRICLIPWIYN